ncbi:MAG: hypothetical protein ACOY35_01520 [Bacillota bacterium]
MENEKFQELVLKRLEDNEKFQALVLQQFLVLTGEIQGLKSDIKDLKTNIKDLKTNQLRLETKVENDVVEQLRGLWEDRQVHLGYYNEINGSQIRIEGKLE